MKKFLFFLLVWFCGVKAFSQKVGLVLSGGGAKGLAHIGVLKALEENEIPIDYIVGTSMGGIVGGCYAAGMSPEQIETMVLSRDFLKWTSGEAEDSYNYYFYKEEADGTFIQMNLSLDSTVHLTVNPTIVNDQPLNFALAERLATASAIARNNFDSLFVPLRVMAAEVFTQSLLELKDGSLGEAVRATMSVPIFFSPIRINNQYVFDGGVLNNFPMDVAQRTFHPDILIGSNVSSRQFREYPYKDDDQWLQKTMNYLLVRYPIVPENANGNIILHPNISPYNVFDFRYAKQLIDSGYRETMRNIETIKKQITRRTTCENVALRRMQFNSHAKPIEIRRIEYDRLNSRQQKFISHYLKKRDSIHYLTDLKKGYFKLTSESFFSSLFPSVRYYPKTNEFTFSVAQRKQSNLNVQVGGVMATRNISQMTLKLDGYHFGKLLHHGQIQAITGSFLKSIQGSLSIHIPYFNRLFVEPLFHLNFWDYTSGQDYLTPENESIPWRRWEQKGGLHVGIPVGHQYSLLAFGYYVSNYDRFFNSASFTSTNTFDQLDLYGSRFGISLSTHQLNYRQYPSAGYALDFSVSRANVRQDYAPGNTSKILNPVDGHYRWYNGNVRWEHYLRKKWYSTGYLLQGVLSNQPTFANYFSTLINMPVAYFLQDSHMLLMRGFRAPSYMTAGIKNVFSIRQNFDFRIEAYLFKPLQLITENENQQAIFRSDLTRVNKVGAATLVFRTFIGPVAFTVNYYDDQKQPFSVLFHAGFLLYPKSNFD